MTRKIIITIGGIILLILLLVWVYLLIFSSPGQANRWFTGGINEPTPIDPIAELEVTNQLAIPNAPLFQLTTKSVAGYGIVFDGSVNATTSEEYTLRYAETGTGHVYEINLNTMIETRISPITFAKTVGATFSPAGEAYVLTAEKANDTESTIYIFDKEPKEYAKLPRNSKHFYFTEDLTLYYTVVENGQTIAYELDYDGGETNILWQIPFTQVNVIWTESGVIINNKVADGIKGGIYTIKEGRLSKVVSPKQALTMVTDQSGQYIWYSYFDNTNQASVSEVVNIEGTLLKETAMTAIPEKCFLNKEDKSVCVISAFLLSAGNSEITKWYRGEIISDDRLWIETDTGIAYEEDLKELAGLTLDASLVMPTPSFDSFFFVNKINGTLWGYKF